MDCELIDIDPGQISLLHAATIELHRHEAAVQPALGEAAARPDDEYWELYTRRFAGWCAAGKGFCVAARSDDGEIAGFVFAVEKQGDTAYDTGDPIGYIEEIAVLERFRGRGIGSALMDAARSRLAARGIAMFKLSMVPDNAAAQRFYESQGLASAARLMIGRTTD